MYIYIAINKVNGKVYIGQTTKTVEERKQKHFQIARSEIKGGKVSTYFHDAIRKYGEGAFKFIQIDEASSIEELNEKEKFWIDVFQSTNSEIGYNTDLGGKNYIRQSTTIEKLRESTSSLHKTNKNYHDSTVQGLRKGTEVWREICKSRRIEKVCPICGNKFYLPPNEAKKRTYCSYNCAAVGNVDVSIKNFKEASRLNHERKVMQNVEIANTIYDWAKANRELVLGCPYNSISTTLNGLRDVIKQKYGFVDWRTICSAIGCRYKKRFLQELKNYLNENIC